MMIKRLLLGVGVIGGLAGCGGAITTAAVTKPSATVHVIEVTNVHHLTVTPASAPMSTPTPAPTAPPALRTPAPRLVVTTTTPPLQRNMLIGPHGLNTRVGPDYTDCTGTSEVAHDSAQIYPCHTSAVLFLGHNRGVFTPLLSFVVGDVINWSDDGGLHHLRIVAVRDVSSSVWPPVLGTYEFQTCLYAMTNSPMNRDLDAVEV